jgi:hypothetical protein
MAETLKTRLGTLLTSLKETVEGMREPLSAKSLDEFMDLVDRREGSVVKLYPTFRENGYYYSRDKKKDEYVGGINEPTWVTEFCLTGYTFLTVWQSRTPTKRHVVYRQEHERMDFYEERKRSDVYDKARERWFYKAIEMAQSQHQQFPPARFMVYGAGGLQDYTYYTEGEHHKVVHV